ncbi:RND transporter [Bradyrhizobium jicamae]|uniref:RND transporter n=1 Tax=Bradyrhizobium jicamae TaxID=280332 RepID=A0A0R3KVV2_9BRAD|nr:efflux RND transporter periplasmic adaptor subunit [Bradyrhizobium jicamae]KRQ96895.1 RND transporter [Bradyrhizobium jicamae]
MNIATEPKLSGKPFTDKPHKRPVRMVRWFIIIGTLLALLAGGLVWFNYFRGKMIAQFFASMKPPPTSVNIATAKSEIIPNLLTAVGDLAAVHQVNVTSDVNGRITDIQFKAGASVKAGTPLVQLFDGPEQGDLANYKAQQRVAQISLDRAKQLAERQVGPQATVDNAQAVFDQASAGIAKTEAIISQKLVRAPFDGELGVRRVEVGQYLTAGTQIVSLTDLSVLFANFTVTEKDSGQLKVGQIVRIAVDAYPGRPFEGKITTIEPQIATETRNIRVQATIQNPDKILKPGMFATTTVVLPDKPPVVTVPETAVDYTLYGDSVYLVSEKKEEDGKTSLTVTRTFVQTGNRIEGRAEILKGLKDGDRVVAVGQLKLQSGSAVTVSSDPVPPIPAKPPRY